MRTPYKGGSFRITSPVGWRLLDGVRDPHYGMDAVGVSSKEITSLTDGVVVMSAYYTAPRYSGDRTYEWGNFVAVTSPDGYTVYYCHMSERYVQAGDQVKLGDVLGVEGSTGKSYGSHCHIELRKGGEKCNIDGDLSRYNIANLIGIPNTVGSYSLEETKEQEDEMDAKMFKELFTEMRRELKDNDCSDYSEDARRWATETGLIEGSGTVDGRPNYMWQDLLTREQFVTVLYRFMKMI